MLDLLTMLVCIVIISLFSKVGLRRVWKVIRQLTKSLTVSLDGIYPIEKRSKPLCQHLIKNPCCPKKFRCWIYFLIVKLVKWVDLLYMWKADDTCPIIFLILNHPYSSINEKRDTTQKKLPISLRKISSFFKQKNQKLNVSLPLRWRPSEPHPKLPLSVPLPYRLSLHLLPQLPLIPTLFWCLHPQILSLFPTMLITIKLKA